MSNVVPKSSLLPISLFPVKGILPKTLTPVASFPKLFTTTPDIFICFASDNIGKLPVFSLPSCEVTVSAPLYPLKVFVVTNPVGATTSIGACTVLLLASIAWLLFT